MKRASFLDTFLMGTIFAAPAVYIGLVIAEIDGVPGIDGLGGVVFFGALIVGSALAGLLVATIRERIAR